MSMYFCYYTFEASNRPKFMGEALDLLTGARGKIFLDRNDVEVLAFQVRKALQANKPKSNTAYVEKHVPDEGCVTIEIYKDDHSDTPSVGRAHFSPVRGFTTYDLDEERFIEVKLKMEEKQS